MVAANPSSVVSKCTRILDLLAEAQRPLSFTEIARQSGFVKSSTHRILAILQSEGLAEFDQRSRAYRMGPKLIAWAMNAWHKTDLQQNAAAELEHLCTTTGYNVALAIRDDDSVLYLRVLDSFPVRHAAKAGEHAPIHCTAVGKALVAFLPDEQRSNLIKRLRLEQFTERSITNATAFARELARVRKRGYSLNDREEFLQVCGIAAPIRDHQAQVAAAVCIWAPVKQADIEVLSGLADLLLDATRRISIRIGSQGD